MGTETNGMDLERSLARSSSTLTLQSLQERTGAITGDAATLMRALAGESLSVETIDTTISEVDAQKKANEQNKILFRSTDTETTLYFPFNYYKEITSAIDDPRRNSINEHTKRNTDVYPINTGLQL